MRRSRKIVVAVGISCAIALAATFGAERWVRARAAAEAERMHVDVAIGAVRPAWGGVRLLGVRAQPRGVEVAAFVDEVRVDVESGHVRAVRAHGGRVEVNADEDALAASLRAWRAALPSASGAHGARAAVSVEGVAIRWAARGVDVTGAWARRDADGRVAIGAARVDVTYSPAVRADSDAATASAPPSPASLHARARATASSIAAKLPAGVDVAIDALAFAPRGDGLALGPGRATLARDDARVVATFTTSAGAGTPLALRAELPLDDGDARVALDGGPVSLARLGVRDGTAGLADLDRATLAGRAEIVLSPASLAFDVDLAARDLALFNRRLARDTLHGLHAAVRARGAISAGAVRLDEVDLAVDRAHLLVRGTIDLDPARAGASLALDVPRTDCQALLDSAPAALLPTVQGVRLEGTLAARARVAVALRRVRDMKLDWDVDASCKIVEVPAHLARERFRRPFLHRFYTSRGEIHEELTGPGTARWTPLGAMSRFLPAAVLMTEDGGFFRRSGFNRAQIDYAIVTDLAERRFARGASTMTMQLAKNLFLSRDKVLARKLEELVLTLYLSQRFTKEEILELYLNVIEVGPDLYGVRDGAAHYFGKSPAEVTLAEALFLASVLPSPLKLHALKRPEGLPDNYVASFHHLMDLAKQSGLITEADAEAGKAETIVFR